MDGDKVIIKKFTNVKSQSGCLLTGECVHWDVFVGLLDVFVDSVMC